MTLLERRVDQPFDPQPEASVMAMAINMTLRTIEERAKLYRGLIVVVSATSIFVLVLTALLRSWTPLLGFGFLVPLTGGYWLLDGKHVGRWRRDILELWCQRDLQFLAFAKSIAAYPSIPPGTLTGMLSALPSLSAKGEPEAFSDAQKRRLADTTSAKARRQRLRTLLAVAALTLTVGLGALAAYQRSTRTLLVSLIVLAIWATGRSRL